MCDRGADRVAIDDFIRDPFKVVKVHIAAADTSCAGFYLNSGYEGKPLGMWKV